MDIEYYRYPDDVYIDYHEESDLSDTDDDMEEDAFNMCIEQNQLDIINNQLVNIKNQLENINLDNLISIQMEYKLVCKTNHALITSSVYIQQLIKWIDDLFFIHEMNNINLNLTEEEQLYKTFTNKCQV